MSEEEQPTEEVVEEPTTTDMVSQAQDAVERIEAANEKAKETIAELTRLQVERTLSGESDAGAPREEKEETAEEYAKRMVGETDGSEE